MTRAGIIRIINFKPRHNINQINVLRVIIVNQALASLYGGSLEFKITFPLKNPHDVRLKARNI